jgi:hypothetical protein
MSSSPFLNGDVRQRRLAPARPGFSRPVRYERTNDFRRRSVWLGVILFGHLVDLTSGAGFDRRSFLRGAFMIRCPRCQSEGIRRSKRRGFVERGPLTLVFLRPFRCKRCERRFFRWPINFNDQSNECMHRGSQSARTSHKFVNNSLSNPPNATNAITGP